MGYTLEELQKAGFKPVEAAAPKRLTLEELQAMGFKPVEDPMSSRSVDLSQPYEGKINPARAAILGAAQGGTLGFADEIGAALGSLARKSEPGMLGPAFALAPDDTPQVRAMKLKALDAELANRLNDPLSYEGLRDAQRAELAQAQAQQPRDYMAGELAGSLLTAPLLPGGGGTGNALRRAMTALGSGAGYGAAAGVGASNAPLASEEMTEDALKGAAFGAGGAAVGQAVPAVLRQTGRGLRALGIDAGRRHLINAKTLTTKAPLDSDAVEAALTSGSILPGTMVTGTLKRLEPRAAAEGQRLASIIKTLKEGGVKGPGYREISKKLAAEGSELAKNSLGSPVPQRYADMADEMLEKGGLKPPSTGGHGHGKPAAPEPPALLDEFGRPFPKPPPVEVPDKLMDIDTAENIKRNLQLEARKEYGRIGGDTQLARAKKRTAALMNAANEERVAQAGASAPAGSPVAMASSEFVPVKERAAALIGARNEARLGAGKVAQHSEFGLPQQIAVADTLVDRGPVAAAGALLKTWPLRQVLNRSSSTIATGAYWPGRGLQALGNLASRVPQRSALGGAVGRALGMEPQAPGAPEPSDVDLERWRLEQELRGQSRPSGAPLRRLLKKGRK